MFVEISSNFRLGIFFAINDIFGIPFFCYLIHHKKYERLRYVVQLTQRLTTEPSLVHK
jgi:hypothetical protein